MPLNRRQFHRPLGERRYRRLFVIAVEGAKTEFQYFSLFQSTASVIQVKVLRSRHDSSPPQVLEKMTRYLKDESLKSTDEAWLVVDKDQWTDEQLIQLFAWSQRASHYGFALSNPKFEYWLLLHFEDGTAIANAGDCSDRLKRYLPDYDKSISVRSFSPERINEAIRRAKARDYPPCVDWPRTLGSTSVYRLVERILQV